MQLLKIGSGLGCYWLWWGQLVGQLTRCPGSFVRYVEGGTLVSCVCEQCVPRRYLAIQGTEVPGVEALWVCWAGTGCWSSPEVPTRQLCLLVCTGCCFALWWATSRDYGEEAEVNN